MVHRERGRVDAILTGIGTVLCDDPLLTPRGVRVRRPALPVRVVIDPWLQISPQAKLVQTARETRTLIACIRQSLDGKTGLARQLEQRGAQLIGLRAPFLRDPAEDQVACELPLDELLRELVSRYDATHVLVEAGPRLLGRLFRQQLVNEAWVFTAPLRAGDDEAASESIALSAAEFTADVPMKRWSLQRRGSDVIARYRVQRH